MEREIKFRAWGVASKVMIYPDSELTSGEIVDRIPNTYVMQFTGLKDKNGKEIWEGDIISKAGAFIVWSTRLGCWCFDFKDAKPNQEVPLFYEKTGATWDYFEVIGNIYENPTLIK